MPGVLIDVVRLLYRRASGVILTGIDRVSLAYVEHYRDSARAVLSLGPLAAALAPADSRRLFEQLLEPVRSGEARTVVGVTCRRCVG